MKRSTLPRSLVSVLLLAGLTACGKKETSAPAPGPAVTETPAPAAAPTRTETAVAVAQTVATAAGVELKIPDFQTASVADLKAVAVKALGDLAATASAGNADFAADVEVVKADVSSGLAQSALMKLADLDASPPAVTGGASMVETGKQLVSAWALKQGFDAARISGVLGALQKGDYTALATQASTLLAQGNLTGDQKGLLNGVMSAFGIDATPAAGTVDAVKGLLGR